MSAETTFWYKRRELIPQKDGTRLLVECEDCINLYDVLRGFWKNDSTFVLQMKDAHEESRLPDVPLKVEEEQKKTGKVPSKERLWVLSYIELHEIDIFRYRTATELMIPSKLDQLTKVQPPTILNKPKVEVTQTAVDQVGNTNQKAENPLKVAKDEAEELPSTLPDFNDIITPLDPPAHEVEETIEIVD